MTTFDRFEHEIPRLMTELAPAQVPDYFDDMLQQAARTRQRPAWSALERWLPMGAIARPIPHAPMSWRPIAILVIIGLLVGAGLIAFVGSLPRVPAPFGPAGNGALFFSDGDDIYRMDSLTAAPRAIVTGPGVDARPLPSRDGTRIAFTREDGSLTVVLVAEQDGTDVRPLVGEYPSFSTYSWSPTGAEIAVRSAVDGAYALTVVETDGSGARTLALGVEVQGFWYRPNGQFVFRGKKSEPVGWSYGLYVVDPDGTDLRPILQPTPNEGDWLGASLSPDGAAIVYRVWRDPDEPGRLYVVDIDTGHNRRIEIAGTTSDQRYDGAQFSPDGTKVLFLRHWSCMALGGERFIDPHDSSSGCQTLSVVSVSGGTAIDIGEQVPAAYDHWDPMASFSPDGQFVIGLGNDTGWLLDPTGVRAGQRITLPSSNGMPIWQRVAP